MAAPGPDELAVPACGLDAGRQVLVAMRPRQWIKNLLVFAAPGAAGILGDSGVAPRVVVAFLALCLVASGGYLLNDVRDAAEDRRHPRKRHRPVASGRLSPELARAAGIVLTGLGLGLAASVNVRLLIVTASYVLLTVFYTYRLRRIALVDLLAIACLFVLRALAGGVASSVTVSNSFLLVVGSAAVFIVAGKRLAELGRGSTPGPSRATLGAYTTAGLRRLLVVSALTACGAYLVWALQRHGTATLPWRLLTAGLFAAVLARYGRLLSRGAGGAPEELLLGDPTLLALACAWGAAFGWAVYVA
jgi:decaprenyl-phosphate phosphoribosyltransferase